jgi:hypothetical protein
MMRFRENDFRLAHPLAHGINFHDADPPSPFGIRVFLKEEVLSIRG